MSTTIQPAALHSMKVMSFNVMCSFCEVTSPDYARWEERLPQFGDIFRRNIPDIVGIQELTFAYEVDEILQQLPSTFEAVFLNDTSIPVLDGYPDSTLLFDAARFGLVDSGHYWNSPNPDQDFFPPIPLGWNGGSFPRNVVWAILADQVNDGQQFFVTTSHFDNAGSNKLNSAHLLLERAGEIAGTLPVILTADYNSQPGSDGYEVMDNGQPLVEFNARDVSSNGPRLDTNDVNVGFEYGCWGADSKVFPDCTIDHVFLGGLKNTWHVTDWVTDVWKYNGRFPSDHRAIQTEIAIVPKN